MSKVKKKNSKKGIIIVVVIVALVIVIRLASYLLLKSASNIDIMLSGVQVQSYGKHDLSESINASGIVESQNVISVTTDFVGKIKELNVSLGDYVNAGDVLCVFDDTELREQIKELETQVSASEKLTAKQNEIAQRNLKQAKDNQTKEVAAASEAVSKAQTDYDNAVITYNSAASAFDELKSKDVDSAVLEEAKVKTDAAYENMMLSQTALSEANSNLERTKQSAAELVQSAQDNVDTNAISNTGNGEISKELAKLYRQLDEVNVLAEQSGIITSLNVSQGSIPNGVLMQIEDNSNLKVKVNIKEKDIIKLKSGMTATVKSDSFPDDSYAGTVSRVINFATSQEENIMVGQSTSAGGYSAEVTIDSETGLLLGMTAKVEIAIKESKEELSVPYDSIMSDEKGTFVYRAVKKKNDKYLIERVEITEGEKSDYYTAIQSDNLKEGDLIVNYPEEVTEGEEVTVYIPEEDNEITTSKESE